MKNTYAISSKTATTGWSPAGQDVNGTNEYNMTPIQVAAQAGNLSEMKAIAAHPDFKPSSAQKMGVYFEICKQDNPSKHKEMMAFFKVTFAYDAERNSWDFKSSTPETAGLSLSDKIHQYREKYLPEYQNPAPQSPSSPKAR